MFIRSVCFGLGLLVLVGLSACSPKAPPQEPQKGQETKTAQIPVKTGWEAEWEKVLQAARKEGKVTVYAITPGPALKAAVPLVKRKFGIDLEVLTGSASEVRNKLAAERKNGLYITDVFMTGMNSLFTVSLPEGWADLLEPELVLPEVKDPGSWFGGTLPWRDGGRRTLTFLYYPTPQISVNTDLVGPRDITSYYHLLDPKWNGKILIGDARVTGTAFNGFSTLATNKVVDLDYFRKVVRQGLVLRDEQLVADWVAKGKYPITLFGATNAQTARYKEAGAPIADIDVKEGTYLSVDGSGTIVLNRRPHPNAARVLINWWLSKEGQIHAQKEMRYHSARTDIGTEGVDPLNIRKPGASYFPSANLSLEWLTKEQDRYQKLAEEIFKTP